MPHVSVCFNLRPDHFSGYNHGDPVRKVFSYEEASTSDMMGLAKESFGAFNAPIELLSVPYCLVAERYQATSNRSLSVGDVLRIDDSWLACALAGWIELRSIPGSWT